MFIQIQLDTTSCLLSLTFCCLLWTFIFTRCHCGK